MLVLDPKPLEEFVEKAGNYGEFFYDVETTPHSDYPDSRGNPALNNIMWMGLATHGDVLKVPMGHPIGSDIIGERIEPRVFADGKTRNFKMPVYSQPPEHMNQATVFEILNPLFEDDDVVKSAHGATFDAASVAKYRDGYIPEGEIACTIVMDWLLDEDKMRYGLKYITEGIYGFKYDDKNIGKQVEIHRMNEVARYLHYDLVYGWAQYKRLKPMIINAGLEDVWKLEKDLTSVLASMRTTGVPIDVERLEGLRVDLSKLVGEKERKFYSVAGKKVNLNAPRQMQELLYKPKSQGGAGIKPWKTTKGGKEKIAKGMKPDHTFYSTDDEALESSKDNPVVSALFDYRETKKVYGTYVIGYLGDPDDDKKPNRVFDGRIYPDFVQYGAATGRFSCREPNLQNVPSPKTELGDMVRGLFVSDPGYDLIVADYGQIELVLLAHFIGEGAFYDGFLNGIDPHTMTAAMALDLDPHDLQERVSSGDKEAKGFRQRFGKSINFATVYGAGIGKLSSMMGVSFEEAKKFKAQYDRNTPEVEAFRKQVLREARSHSMRKTGMPPHVTTIMGHVRRMPELMSADDKVRMRAERQAFNAKIQGSSADLTKLAMVRYHATKEPDWQLLVTVHDELGTQAPKDDVERAKACLAEAMTGEGIQELVSLPLKIDLNVVDRWSKAK